MRPAGKRKAVVHLREAFGMRERRACKAIGCCRMTMRYRTSRADDANLRQRMRAIAQERRRFGYRRLHVLLRREGYLINPKKLLRLYREEKLTVRRRGGRKRAIQANPPAGANSELDKTWGQGQMRPIWRAFGVPHINKDYATALKGIDAFALATEAWSVAPVKPRQHQGGMI